MFTGLAHNQQDYAYRRVCKSGVIQPLAFGDIEKLREHAADYTQDYTNMNIALKDAGVSFDRLMTGKGESVIILSTAADAEATLDTLYNVPKLDHSAKVLPFAKKSEERESSFMRIAFDEAAEKYPVRASFRAAAANKYVADNTYAPAMALQAA